MQPAVSAEKLQKYFGTLAAVDSIDFDIMSGQCFGILGPNGAGKTTTVAMIYCFLPVGLVPHIDSFSYFFTILVTPMFLFSGVFFPIEALPESVRLVTWFLPLYHIVVLLRSLVLGVVSPSLLVNAAWLIVFILILFPLPQIMMRRLVR